MLQVRNLRVDYSSRDGKRRAVDDVSFDIDSGEALGLLGESGCGKTTLAFALLRLLPHTARVASGSIRFCEHDVLRADERTLRTMRGAEASIIFQEPALSLNPVMRVGEQVAEVARAHARGTGKRYREQAESALAEVRLSESRIYDSYPHQLSSGQRQRIAIAQALVCKPRLVIADEPTSALDNITQSEIVDLLKELRRRLHIGLLFITHNPALLVGLTDRLLVMRAGRVVEDGLLAQVYEHPSDPYTQSLLQSVPCEHADNL